MNSPTPSSSNPAALSTERVLSATPVQVFAAFEKAELLTQWWGPKGFRNTFEVFEFQPGGRWNFVMHAPNGADFVNESFFREIEPNSRIVIEHVVQPWFCLTVTLTPQEDGQRTLLNWVQEFESPAFAERMRALSGTANEQVLDRLETVLAGRQVD